ncbi:MAG: OmpA family protein [Planctomycetota bacterium]
MGDLRQSKQTVSGRVVRRAMAALAAVTLGVIGTGCVSQQQYDDAVETIRTLESRLTELQEQNRSAQVTIDRQAGQIGSYRDETQQLQSRFSELATSGAELQQEVQDVEQRLRTIRFSNLDPATDRALQQVAAANPGLVIYDSARGMLRFSSDLTFAPGSATVQAGASQGLAAVARVLNSAAGAYDVRVVGHTDSQQISNPNTRRRHPTNRHLSVHRAIAVSEALQQQGVAANRIETAGWGAQRPAVPNNASGGTPENRRVEIFVVPREDVALAPPTTSGATGSTPVSRPAPSPPPIVK